MTKLVTAIAVGVSAMEVDGNFSSLEISNQVSGSRECRTGKHTVNMMIVGVEGR
jgi:hypothetical protein